MCRLLGDHNLFIHVIVSVIYILQLINYFIASGISRILCTQLESCKEPYYSPWLKENTRKGRHITISLYCEMAIILMVVVMMVMVVMMMMMMTMIYRQRVLFLSCSRCKHFALKSSAFLFLMLLYVLSKSLLRQSQLPCEALLRLS